MSNSEEIWTPPPATDGEYTFDGWLHWETKFGEFGVSGYSEVEEFLKIPKVFGSEEPVKIFFTLYRQLEDGLLICVHLKYFDNEGVRHPLLMLVHPDHRGKGVATTMTLYLENKFIENEASSFGYTVEEFKALPRAERAALTVPKVFDVSYNEAGRGLASHVTKMFYTVEKDFTGE